MTKKILTAALTAAGSTYRRGLGRHLELFRVTEGPYSYRVFTFGAAALADELLSSAALKPLALEFVSERSAFYEGRIRNYAPSTKPLSPNQRVFDQWTAELGLLTALKQALESL